MYTYIDAVLGAGGLPILIPLSLRGDDLQAVYHKLDGVLIPGGGDIDPKLYGVSVLHPKTHDIDDDRDQVELELTRQALKDHKPVFGICRGMQVLSVALGGTLYQDIPDELASPLEHMHRYPTFPREHFAHQVQIEEDSLLSQVMGTPIVEVNSRHHQSVKEVPANARIVARAPDGVIEAVEVPLSDHPFALAVQWHPENLQAQVAQRGLFLKFIEASAKAL